jgi:hypothetical protein
VQEQGKNIKSFRDIEKQQGQRQKIIWESALLIIWLTSSSVWYWKKERKKEGTYLGWDFIACTKQKFFCNNSFIQPKTKKKQKNNDLKKRKSFCLASRQRDKHQSLFHLSLGKKEIVGPCAKITIGGVVLLEIFFFLFFLATDYCSGGGRRRVLPKSATRPKIRPPHNHPLHQPR